MNWLEWFYIICFILLMGKLLFIAIKKIYFVGKNRKNIYTQARLIFSKLYQYNEAFHISKNERQRLKLYDYSMVYGEIEFDGFSKIMALVEPKPGDIFYDLGAGSGRAIFAAALLYPWKKVCGIEILPGLYELCLAQHKAFKKLLMDVEYSYDWKIDIDFICGDLFEQDISEANVVFINATGFFGELKTQLNEKLNQLKTGARIIITSKGLPQEKFKLIAKKFVLMSWGYSQCFVYHKL